VSRNILRKNIRWQVASAGQAICDQKVASRPASRGLFAGVPAEEVRGLRVAAMMVARSPTSWSRETVGRLDGACRS